MKLMMAFNMNNIVILLEERANKETKKGNFNVFLCVREKDS